jgi:hypothetical protein
MPDIENIFLEKPDIPVIRPELKEGTRVIIINKQHPFHKLSGKIIQRDHRHYRVQFPNTIMWCPEHWIEPDKLTV